MIGTQADVLSNAIEGLSIADDASHIRGARVGAIEVVRRRIAECPPGAGVFVEMVDATIVGRPDFLRLLAGGRRAVPVVHPDRISIGARIDPRHAHPDVGFARYVPRLDLVGEGCAICIDEPQVFAVGHEVAEIDVDAIDELYQHREAVEILRLRGIVKGEFLPRAPVGIPPIDTEGSVLCNCIGIDYRDWIAVARNRGNRHEPTERGCAARGIGGRCHNELAAQNPDRHDGGKRDVPGGVGPDGRGTDIGHRITESPCIEIQHECLIGRAAQGSLNGRLGPVRDRKRRQDRSSLRGIGAAENPEMLRAARIEIISLNGNHGSRAVNGYSPVATVVDDIAFAEFRTTNNDVGGIGVDLDGVTTHAEVQRPSGVGSDDISLDGDVAAVRYLDGIVLRVADNVVGYGDVRLVRDLDGIVVDDERGSAGYVDTDMVSLNHDIGSVDEYSACSDTTVV